MYKWLYERMVREYESKSKEELAQIIMSLKEIECKDRCFANECEAGSSIDNINQLFSSIDEFTSNCDCDVINHEKLAKVIELSSIASKSWNFIKSELSLMNDDRRCSDHLSDFKKRVANAKRPDDDI